MSAKAVRELLGPLIADAERRGLWLHSRYHDLWFSPRQLRKANAEGRFLWGPCNWSLRSPEEYLAQAKEKLDAARHEFERRRELVTRVKQQ